MKASELRKTAEWRHLVDALGWCVGRLLSKADMELAKARVEYTDDDVDQLILDALREHGGFKLTGGVMVTQNCMDMARVNAIGDALYGIECAMEVISESIYGETSMRNVLGAARWLREGHKVQRRGWGDAYLWRDDKGNIMLYTPETNDFRGNVVIGGTSMQARLIGWKNPWEPTLTDLLVTDYMIYEEV